MINNIGPLQFLQQQKKRCTKYHPKCFFFIITDYLFSLSTEIILQFCAGNQHHIAGLLVARYIHLPVSVIGYMWLPSLLVGILQLQSFPFYRPRNMMIDLVQIPFIWHLMISKNGLSGMQRKKASCLIAAPSGYIPCLWVHRIGFPVF